MYALSALLLLVLSCTCDAASQRACLLEASFPHLSTAAPFAAPAPTRVPLRLHFACDAAGRAVGRGRGRAVAVVLQGAFTAARTYDPLAAALARRGLVVAVLQYAARDLATILKDVPALQGHFRRASRNGCPSILPFPSAAVAASAMRYLRNGTVRADVRSTLDVRRTILIGHSAGGVAASLLASSACAMETEDIQTVLACEGIAQVPRRTRVVGVVTYEGHTAETAAVVRAGVPVVTVSSRFYYARGAELVGRGSFGGRLARVRIGGANHFGLNGFVNKRQQPVCAVERTGEEAGFRTTAGRQKRAVISVAAVVVAGLDGFEGKGFGRLERLVGMERLAVREAVVQ